MSLEIESDEKNKDPNQTQKPKNLTLEELLSIKKEIESYREEKTPMSSLSSLALKFLDNEEDLDNKINELKKEKNREDLELLKAKKKELEDRLEDKEKLSNYNNAKSEYEKLSEEYDRLDKMGNVSTIEIVKEMESRQEEINSYEESRQKDDEELAIIDLEIEKLERQ